MSMTFVTMVGLPLDSVTSVGQVPASPTLYGSNCEITGWQGTMLILPVYRSKLMAEYNSISDARRQVSTFH
jgi:hypothetical protein